MSFKYIYGCKALITQKCTLYGIRYRLYDLLSATDDIQVMQRGKSKIWSLRRPNRIAYSKYCIACDQGLNSIHGAFRNEKPVLCQFDFLLETYITVSLSNLIQFDTLKVMAGSKVTGQRSQGRKFYIFPAVEVFFMLKKQTHLHYVEVDSDEDKRQSKMAANSKSHAVSQTSYARADGNFHILWNMA